MFNKIIGIFVCTSEDVAKFGCPVWRCTDSSSKSGGFLATAKVGELDPPVWALFLNENVLVVNVSAAPSGWEVMT
jgi:hypothetical protein